MRLRRGSRLRALSVGGGGRVRAPARGGLRGSFRIKRHELAHYAISPAKAVLQRIFTAATGLPGGQYIVLLHQLSGFSVNALDIQHPPARYGLRQRKNRVLAKPRYTDPLQRCPTVGCIPLLS